MFDSVAIDNGYVNLFIGKRARALLYHMFLVDE